MNTRAVSTRQLSHWPDAWQRLLLDAAVRRDERGISAWKRWIVENRVESADSGSRNLLPGVYANLSELGYRGAELDEIRKIYEQTWLRNQLLKHRLKLTLSSLESAGVDAIPLKGMSLALSYYRNLGMRMMNDVDLLVRPDDVSRTHEVLRQVGWQTEQSSPDDRLLPFLHSDAKPWTHSSWQALDLHWHLFHIDCDRKVVDDIWNRMVWRRVDDFEFKSLDSTDSLILICFHSRKADTQSSCRWVLDVLALCDSDEPQVEWDCIVERAQNVGMLLPVRDALTYLQEEFDARIPEDVIEGLTSVQPSKQDFERYRQLAKSHRHDSVKLMFSTHWWRYRNGAGVCGKKRSLTGFIKYLSMYGQYRYQCSSLWQLAARLLRLPHSRCAAKRPANSLTSAPPIS